MSTSEYIAQLAEAHSKAHQDLLDFSSSLEQRVKAKEQEVEQFIANARGEIPLIRTSVNQYGNIDSSTNNLQGWIKSSDFTINVSLYRQIHTGVLWDDRDAEEQEILTAMNMAGRQHFFPSAINVLRMTWSGNGSSERVTIFPDTMPVQQSFTEACYAKLVSGSIYGQFLGHSDLAVNTEWNLCGNSNRGIKPGVYWHSHPAATSDSGEVLFIWPALVQGYMHLDRSNPMWRWIPHQSAASPNDTSI